MNKQSLLEARKLILKVLSESNIELLDKLELMNNINILLKDENYNEHIKVLKMYNNNKKPGGNYDAR